MEISERRKARSKGICSECASRPVAPGKKRCQQCIDASNARKKAIVEERRANGLCIWCGAPAVPGKSRCQKHLDAAKKYAKHNYRPRSKPAQSDVPVKGANLFLKRMEERLTESEYNAFVADRTAHEIFDFVAKLIKDHGNSNI